LSQELTDSEKRFLGLQALLAEELKLVVGAGSDLKNVVTNSLERVMQWLDTRLEAFQVSSVLVRVVEGLSIHNNDGSGDAARLLACIPDWKILHESYTTFEVRDDLFYSVSLFISYGFQNTNHTPKPSGPQLHLCVHSLH
jgi:hypothetical protein